LILIQVTARPRGKYITITLILICMKLTNPTGMRHVIGGFSMKGSGGGTKIIQVFIGKIVSLTFL